MMEQRGLVVADDGEEPVLLDPGCCLLAFRTTVDQIANADQAVVARIEADTRKLVPNCCEMTMNITNNEVAASLVAREFEVVNEHGFKRYPHRGRQPWTGPAPHTDPGKRPGNRHDRSAALARLASAGRS